MEIETPCREWQGRKTKAGYGQKQHNGKTVYAHRWVMAEIHGWDAIEGLEIMHLCDNPPCFRYDHLRIGTHADNMTDAWQKGRIRQPDTHRGSTHGMSKLTEADVLAIRASNESGVALAKRYGVNRSNISQIRTRKTWTHI